ncbi:HNH endonuclease, partial [Akkermansia muciniphila]|nr:HNH endonuclease [Akkermansia muciniphila]
MCCGNSILQKGLPFFYLHKIFYTLYLIDIRYF